MALLGSGMFVLGIPLAITLASQAQREGPDPGFAKATWVVLAAEALIVAGVLAYRAIW